MNYSDPFGLCGKGEDEDPCPSLVDQVNQAMANAFADLANTALEVSAEAINMFTGLKDLFTATGLNPNAQDAASRAEGAVSAAMVVGGPLGEGARPVLKLLHDEKTLLKTSLDYFRRQGTEEIVRSLRPGAVEPLIVNARGTVMQGNHRIFVLMERGFDVNSLPRVPHP